MEICLPLIIKEDELPPSSIIASVAPSFNKIEDVSLNVAPFEAMPDLSMAIRINVLPSSRMPTAERGSFCCDLNGIISPSFNKVQNPPKANFVELSGSKSFCESIILADKLLFSSVSNISAA